VFQLRKVPVLQALHLVLQLLQVIASNNKFAVPPKAGYYLPVKLVQLS
jgi:hypothetical protein